MGDLIQRPTRYPGGSSILPLSAAGGLNSPSSGYLMHVRGRTDTPHAPANIKHGEMKAMLNFKKAALNACKLIPSLALPMLIAACTSPKANVPAGNVVVDGNCAVDGQGRVKGRVGFNGWAVGSSKVAPESIKVTIGDGQPITAVLYDRPDIAKAYRTEALTKTGYRVDVKDAEAPPGAEIKIFAHQGDKIHQCTKTFRIK